MAAENKRCPFCGHTVIQARYIEGGNSNGVAAYCIRCKSRGPSVWIKREYERIVYRDAFPVHGLGNVMKRQALMMWNNQCGTVDPLSKMAYDYHSAPKGGYRHPDFKAPEPTDEENKLYDLQHAALETILAKRRELEESFGVEFELQMLLTGDNATLAFTPKQKKVE